MYQIINQFSYNLVLNFRSLISFVLSFCPDSFRDFSSAREKRVISGDNQ